MADSEITIANLPQPHIKLSRIFSDKHLTLEDIMDALDANQDGDAFLYVTCHRNSFCYDHSAGRWYEFNGYYWIEDIKSKAIAEVEKVIEIYVLVAEVYGRIVVESAQKGMSEANDYLRIYKKLLKRINELRTLHRKGDVIKLATFGDGKLRIKGTEWDQKPMLLACANGVIDLKNGRLIEGKPEQYLKTASPIKYIEDADDPVIFIQFLNDLFAGNQAIIDYVQRLLGYCLIGKVIDHIFIILWGIGRNGKGTLLQIISDVLGPLAGPVSSSLLLDHGRTRSSAAPSPDIVDLRGNEI